MKTGYLLTALLVAAFLASCISDDNRCGEGEIYITDVADGEKPYCFDPNETLDAGPDADAGGGEPGVDGLGEPCVYGGGECDNYKANFCYAAQVAGAEGYCTNLDCFVDPSDCPSGYTCCDFMHMDMTFCLIDDDFLNSGMCK